MAFCSVVSVGMPVAVVGLKVGCAVWNVAMACAIWLLSFSPSAVAMVCTFAPTFVPYQFETLIVSSPAMLPFPHATNATRPAEYELTERMLTPSPWGSHEGRGVTSPV